LEKCKIVYFLSRIRSKLLIYQWYQVALKRTGRFAELILDSKEKSETIYAGEFSQLNIEEDLLYIGGVDYGETADLNPSFRGCIDLNKVSCVLFTANKRGLIKK
jgi:Laminin G domain